MKEFIEKLIGRLEEYKYSHLVEHDKERLEHCTENERAEHCEGIDCFWCVWNKSIEIVNQLAEEYNQEKPTKTNENQEWIPTAERLPEKNAIVLTCDKDGWISVNVYMPYMGVKNDFECGYYVAWMPLPEAYKPEGE